MSVFEYADHFKHLLHFNTMTVDEEWQCRKFENGLRGDVKLLVAGLEIRDFLTLVEKARFMEKTKRDTKSQQSQPLRVGGPTTSRGGSISRKTFFSRPTSSGSRGSSSQPSVQ